MNSIYNWIFDTSEKKLEEQSKDIYQIKEYDGMLWLTYNGALICPTEMFARDSLQALDEIRKMYVERNTNKQ